MAPPTWVPGQILTAADVNSWFVPLVAYKSADLGRNTATLSADPDLTVPVIASAVYTVECVLFYKANNIDVIFQWKFNIPAGSAGGLYYAAYLNSSGSSLIDEADQWTDTHGADAPVNPNIYPVFIRGTLATAGTAGNLTLSWAGPSAVPTTTLCARSHMVLQRVG